MRRLQTWRLQRSPEWRRQMAESETAWKQWADRTGYPDITGLLPDGRVFRLVNGERIVDPWADEMREKILHPWRARWRKLIGRHGQASATGGSEAFLNG